MTSNQISAASVREVTRHDEEVEGETRRHNEQMEQLDSEKNAITHSYNQKSLELQEWYNTEYINYLNASEQDKVAIEGTLNDIRQQQADAEKAYKEEMVRIQGQAQVWNEQYQAGLLELEGENLNIANKRQYYEQQKTEAYINDLQVQHDLAYKKLNQEMSKIEHDYELGLIDSKTRMEQVKNAQLQFQFEMTKYAQVGKQNIEASTAEMKQRTLQEAANTAATIVNAGANLVDSIMPF